MSDGVEESIMSKADYRARLKYLHSKQARIDSLRRRWLSKPRLARWALLFGGASGLLSALVGYALLN